MVVSLLCCSQTECLIVVKVIAHVCLIVIILSYIAVYNHETHAQVSSASVINVGILFVMFIIS